jgi:hypothetical protein
MLPLQSGVFAWCIASLLSNHKVPCASSAEAHLKLLLVPQLVSVRQGLPKERLFSAHFLPLQV